MQNRQDISADDAQRSQSFQQRRLAPGQTPAKSLNIETSENAENTPVVNMVNKNKTEEDDKVESALQKFIQGHSKKLRRIYH